MIKKSITKKSVKVKNHNNKIIQGVLPTETCLLIVNHIPTLFYITQTIRVEW